MSFNYALFITHSNPYYLVYNAEWADKELGINGYISAHEDLLNVLKSHMMEKASLGLCPTDFTLHQETNGVTIERLWATEEAARDWLKLVLEINPQYDTPLPTQARLVNLVTNDEIIIYPE